MGAVQTLLASTSTVISAGSAIPWQTLQLRVAQSVVDAQLFQQPSRDWHVCLHWSGMSCEEIPCSQAAYTPHRTCVSGALSGIIYDNGHVCTTQCMLLLQNPSSIVHSSSAGDALHMDAKEPSISIGSSPRAQFQTNTSTM
jgi:hypothetical protein